MFESWKTSMLFILCIAICIYLGHATLELAIWYSEYIRWKNYYFKDFILIENLDYYEFSLVWRVKLRYMKGCILIWNLAILKQLVFYEKWLDIWITYIFRTSSVMNFDYIFRASHDSQYLTKASSQTQPLHNQISSYSTKRGCNTYLQKPNTLSS